MTREEYIKSRKNSLLSVECLYDYWKDSRKDEYKNPTLEEFRKSMGRYLSIVGTIDTKRVTDYLDSKFNITLVSKGNKLIHAY